MWMNTSNFPNKKCIINAYRYPIKSIVLSRIDYGSQLWSPNKKGYICELERIQQSFTKYISGMQNLSYHQRLNALRLYSLQRRRDRYIVIYMWKILENLVPNLIPKVQIYTSQRRGRLCYTQHVPIGHIGTICFNSFRWKASRLFNSLPANIRNTTNCREDHISYVSCWRSG